MSYNAPEVPFDPVRCADLHNQLLARAIEAAASSTRQQQDAPRRVTRDLIEHMTQAAPTWPHGIQVPEDSPIYHFLSLIDLHAMTPDEFPLTPEMHQPDPYLFDNGFITENEDGLNVILLYPDATLTPNHGNGGVFFNIDTNRACWNLTEMGFPSEDFWVPLEVILRKQLLKWDQGKFFWGPADGREWEALSTRSWVANDLELAIAGWDTLREAIQNRLPHADGSSLREEKPPIPSEILHDLKVSSFARAFLAKAKRPSFTFVAPGITSFTTESIVELYAAEPPTSPRLTADLDLDGGDEYASLILPAVGNPVPEPAPGNRHFEKGWGNAKNTVLRRAGLYVNRRSYGSDGDDVVLITHEGVDDAFKHHGRRPWGPYRMFSLSEMLFAWAGLVEDGIWEVGPDGVSTPASWLTDPETEQFRIMRWISALPPDDEEEH
ncbi:hypothetical protein SODALDRAFT_326619 [Sodiomyces alkalinus F11]|uniref:Uncharacterized protein n=1 Tax=Sodiomyces alkalinus (strain CBS 110278 / VKM F-3762 / F11) TaxID=1314773 RepID=A0A3N2Q6T5_SODAK|nr:hypothetical protein SODALDRAFT_326619 [Sodiomyces alkalinus F11]ROT42460.1 hypothetical protein SODALDRAFT_326619 [Sodiomyces alkalinus F11]